MAQEMVFTKEVTYKFVYAGQEIFRERYRSNVDNRRYFGEMPTGAMGEPLGDIMKFTPQKGELSTGADHEVIQAELVGYYVEEDTTMNPAPNRKTLKLVFRLPDTGQYVDGLYQQYAFYNWNEDTQQADIYTEREGFTVNMA